MRALAGAAAAVFALALAGCATATTPVGSSLALRPDDAPQFDEPSYHDSLRRYSKEGAIYDGLDHRVFAVATWQSWAFRQRRVHAYSTFKDLSQGERDSLIAREREEALKHVDFFVGFYTNQTEWNDLAAPDTIWRIELQPEGGGAILPATVERVPRPDANTRALYPYLTPFWVAYRIRFPAEDSRGRSLFPVGSPRMTLRFASAVGRLELPYSILGEEQPSLPEPSAR